MEIREAEKIPWQSLIEAEAKWIELKISTWDWVEIENLLRVFVQNLSTLAILSKTSYKSLDFKSLAGLP